MSEKREGAKQIIGAFGARSTLELAFKGHGLSLADKLWYRAPGATERWEDVNFFDNDWDAAFCEAILTHDYKRLASCSPDVPDVTTGGRTGKAWERTGEGTYLLKEPLFENGYDLIGASLAAELCGLLYGQDAYQPLNVVQRFGRRFVSSPLMLSRDEELVQDLRLFAMGGFGMNDALRLAGPLSSQDYIDVLARVGVSDASACLARMFAFKVLALIADMHPGNYGVIRNIETGACRAAPPFDYDRSFGFLSEDYPLEVMCKNPSLASLLCAKEFSGLDPSWDWSWYDPQKLSGFESRIQEAYASFSDLPAGFAALVADLFAVQRDYVIEQLSERLRGLARERCGGYSATIITNGYLLTQENIDMLERCRVALAQVTIDGLGVTHDATRYLRGGGSTFERIVGNLREAKLPFKVDIRHNVYEGNRDEGLSRPSPW